MKQPVQSRRTENVSLVDVPLPIAGPGETLVQVRASLLSSGTERAMAEFAGKSLLGRARARSDLVRQVVNETRNEGVASAGNVGMDIPRQIYYDKELHLRASRG